MTLNQLSLSLQFGKFDGVANPARDLVARKHSAVGGDAIKAAELQ